MISQYLTYKLTYNHIFLPIYRRLTSEKKVITVVDKSDLTLVLQGLLYFDEIDIHGVEDMVEKIIMRANKQGTIYLLNIEGHGNEGLQMVDLKKWEYIDSDNLKTHAAVLRKLKPYFRKDATVILHGCKAGAGFKGQSLLMGLSQIWGVPVKAGIINQKLPPGLEGDVQYCNEVKCILIKKEK